MISTLKYRWNGAKYDVPHQYTEQRTQKASFAMLPIPSSAVKFTVSIVLQSKLFNGNSGAISTNADALFPCYRFKEQALDIVLLSHSQGNQLLCEWRLKGGESFCSSSTTHNVRTALHLKGGRWSRRTRMCKACLVLGVSQQSPRLMVATSRASHCPSVRSFAM